MVTPLWSSEPYSVGQRFIEEFPAPTSSVLEAQAEETLRSNPTMVIADSLRLRSAYNDENSALIDADEARQRAAADGIRLNIPNTGIRERAFNMLMQSKKEERDRQLIMSRAEGGLAENAGRVGVSLGTALLDPLNVAASFIPIVGEARWAEALNAAGSTAGRLGVRAGYGALEGAAGAALIEPIIYSGMNYQQADYSLQDSLLNVTFGGLLGGGLHMGAGAIGDALNRGHEWWRAKPEGDIPQYLNKLSTTDRETILRSALGQAAEGKRIDIESLTPDFRESLGIEKRPFNAADLETRTGISGVLRSIDRANDPARFEVEDLGIRGEDIAARTDRLDKIGRQQRPDLYRRIDESIAKIDEATNKITDEFPVSASREENVQNAKARAAEITKQLRKTDLSPLDRQRLERERTKVADVANAAKELDSLERERARFAEQVQRQNPPLKPTQKYNVKQVQESAMRTEGARGQMLFDQNLLDEIDSKLAATTEKVQKPKAPGAEEPNPAADIDAESAEITADLKALSETMGIDLKEDLKPGEDAVALADVYSKVLKSLADCGLRRG